MRCSEVVLMKWWCWKSSSHISLHIVAFVDSNKFQAEWRCVFQEVAASVAPVWHSVSYSCTATLGF